MDNYEVVSPWPDQCLDALTHLRAFVQMVDLELDEAKLYSWSTSRQGWKFVRAEGSSVLLSARDLGGHINYGKKNTMYTIQNRILELHDFWTWLKRSQAPLSQKLGALSGVAWPRCLHGIPGAIIGLDHFGRLRSAAMAALGFDKVGANLLVQLSLVCSPSIDPGFFALWSTLRTFVGLQNRDLLFLY